MDISNYVLQGTKFQGTRILDLPPDEIATLGSYRPNAEDWRAIREYSARMRRARSYYSTKPWTAPRHFSNN